MPGRLLAVLSDIADIAEVLEASTRIIERHWKKLQKAGHLRRVGSDNGGRWEVT